MSDQALRSGLIRLAHTKPELRPALLPLIEKHAGSWTPERRLVTALNAVAEAITHVSLLARESRPAQQDADRALKLLEGAEQVLGRDVARNLSLPGYRAAAASYKAGGAGKKAAAGIPVTLKREVKLKDGTVLPKGAQGSLRFNANAPRVVTVDFDMRPNTNLGVAGLYENFGRPFMKVPSMRTLTQMGEGLSKSVTGKTVEPDGYGPDGSPSWLLVLGMI